jgi:hypothetical protein
MHIAIFFDAIASIQSLVSKFEGKVPPRVSFFFSWGILVEGPFFLVPGRIFKGREMKEERSV